MKKLKVSVIIPVYNAEKTIDRCLNYLTNQSYTNIEIIVVNDGSTDRSEYIIEKFRKKYNNIKYIKKNNEGVSSARNTGIKKSTGDYICFCDSDDYYEYDAIENLINHCKDADIVISSVKKKYVNRVEFSSIGNLYTSEDEKIKEIIFSMTKNHMINQMWCKLFKREIITQNKIFLNHCMHIGEDLDWMCRYFRYVKSVSCIDKVTYNYIIENKESLSQKFSKYFFEQNIVANHSLECLYRFKKMDLSIINELNLLKAWQSLMIVNSNTCYMKKSEKIEYIKNIIMSNKYKEIIKENKKGALKGKIMQLNNPYIIYIASFALNFKYVYFKNKK